MPAQRTVEPAVSEFSQRRERLDSILVGFGFDPALIDQKIKELNTPMGPSDYVGGLSTLSANSTADEVAYAIAAWLFHSSLYSQVYEGIVGGERTGLVGLDNLCTDDRTLNAALVELFRGAYYMSGALAINRQGENRLEAEADKYGLDLEKFRYATIFQLWSSQRGVAQETIDEVGAQLFGTEWEYGRLAGSRLSPPDRSHEQYYFKTEDAIDLVKAYKSMAESPAPTTFAEEQERAQESTFDADFRSRYQRGALSISDTMDRVLTEGLGWGRTYSRFFSNYEMDKVEEGAVFSAWANNQDLTEEQKAQINDIGRAQYGDNNWALATLLGSHLSPSRANPREYVLKTDDVKAFQADLDNFRTMSSTVRMAGAGKVAVAPVEKALAETDAVASLATQYSTGGEENPRTISPEYIAEAVRLILSGRTNVSFGFVGTGDLSVGYQWIGNRFVYNFGPIAADEDMPNSTGLNEKIHDLADGLKDLGVRSVTARLSPEQQADLAGRIA